MTILWIVLVILLGFGGWGLTLYNLQHHKKQQSLLRLKEYEDHKSGLEHTLYQTLLDFIDSVPEKILLLDKEGTLLHTNAQASKEVDDTIPAILRHPQFFLQRDKILSRRKSSFTLSLGYGTKRHFLINMQMAKYSFIETPFILVSITNWNHQYHFEQARNDFIANASHELRTPLTTMKGIMETILGPAAEDEPIKTKFLGIMNEKIHYVISLTNNLLALSQLQSIPYIPEKKNFNLLVLLNKIVEEMRQAFPALHYFLSSQDKAVLVHAHPIYMEQLIRNLLDNASRYAGKKNNQRLTQGEIHINLCHIENGKHHKWPENSGILLTIADNGPGVSSKDITRLTERFYRADLHSPGSGLGLAIVKHIVTLHAGYMRIESQPDEGTQIYIWLPKA